MSSLASPFYRVALKGLVFDEAQRLLVVQADDGLWEMPGGGWEHDESIEECFNREFQEELGVGVEGVGDFAFLYRCINRRGYVPLRLAYRASVSSHDFKPDDDIVAAKFVTRDEFMALNFAPDEATITEYVDQIWSAS